MMKIFKYIILIAFLSTSTSFAATNEECKNMGSLSGFNLYECRVKNICNKANYYKEESKEIPKIIKTEKYKSAEELKDDPDFSVWFTNTSELFPLEMAKNKYREDQNNIYKCGILASQKKNLELIKKLIKSDDTGSVKDKIEGELDFKIKKVENSAEKVGNGCETAIKNFDSLKKSVLDQSTYEMCKYVYYLDYLENSYYNDIKNALGISSEELESIQENEESFNIDNIASKQKMILTSIKEEKEHTYKIYPIAYTAYTEYDNFLPLHIALEIIKQDFYVYRYKLYQTLNPINQVVYKIINAMSK